MVGGGARRVNHEQQKALVRPFVEEEVKAAIKALNAEGARGLDGIPMVFYKEFWEFIRAEVMVTLEEFQQQTSNTEKINKSHIFILPKCQGVVREEDFRSISLSNSIYLIIAKVLAN